MEEVQILNQGVYNLRKKEQVNKNTEKQVEKHIRYV